MKNEKSLYDEIFMTNAAPDIKDTNSSKDIKDAIDDANLNDTVRMEDIFVFEDKNSKDKKEPEKFTKPENKDLKEDIKLEDAKFFDLVNNTLVDLRLDLDKVDLSSELASMKETSKENVIPEIANITTPTPTLEDKIETPVVGNITLEDFKASNKIPKDSLTSEVTAPTEEPTKSNKNTNFAWLSYIFVILLVLVAIGGSLTFLVHQFK